MNLETRVNRITGQLQGILKMIKEERDPEAILQQISAIKSAVDGLTKELVAHHVSGHISKGDKEKITRIISKAIAL